MAEISSSIKTSMVIGDHYEKIVVLLDDFALLPNMGLSMFKYGICHKHYKSNSMYLIKKGMHSHPLKS